MNHHFINNMKKEDLRKVVITDCNNTANGKLGYFHGFFTVGDQLEGLDNYALIELETGIMVTVKVWGIRFIDKFPNT